MSVIVCIWACECISLRSPEEGASSPGAGMTGSCTWLLGTKLGYSGRAKCDPNY